MDHKVKTQNEWQTDIRRTGSPKDSRRIANGWQKDACQKDRKRTGSPKDSRRIANGWQKDAKRISRRTGSSKDSRRIAKGWQRDAKRIAKGQIVWKERFFEG